MDWLKRAAVPDDEACIASMWLRSLCHGQDARASGLKAASQRGSSAQMQYWAELQPIVTALVRGADVVVCCDPERATYTTGAPAVIWGWLVTGEDTIYGCGIKRSVTRAGLGHDVARDMLGDRLDYPQRTVMDLVDLAALRLVPEAWFGEPGWLSSLRQMHTRVLEDDAVYQAVAAYVLDPTRAAWLPSSRRTAA